MQTRTHHHRSRYSVLRKHTLHPVDRAPPFRSHYQTENGSLPTFISSRQYDPKPKSRSPLEEQSLPPLRILFPSTSLPMQLSGQSMRMGDCSNAEFNNFPPMVSCHCRFPRKDRCGLKFVTTCRFNPDLPPEF